MKIGDIYTIRKQKAGISIIPIDKKSPFVNKANFLKKIKHDLKFSKT